MANTDLVNEGLLGAYHDELMKTHLAGGVVFDISAYNLTNGQPTPYADLAAALGTNGANVPEPLRKGGMSVKFVCSVDNKYVQYRLMSDTFNTTVANWQGVDEKPTAGSENLVKSGGVAQFIRGFNESSDCFTIVDITEAVLGYIRNNKLIWLGELEAENVINNTKNPIFNVNAEQTNSVYSVVLLDATDAVILGFDENGNQIQESTDNNYESGDEVLREDVYLRNIEKDDILMSAKQFGSENPNLQLLITTDTHGEPSSVENAVIAADKFKSIDAIIHLGDITTFDPRITENLAGRTHLLSASRVPFYFVIGNHEAGEGTRCIEGSMSDKELYDACIAPMVRKGALISGEYEDGKLYYYHDFVSYNKKLIVLYDYDDSNPINTSDNPTPVSANQWDNPQWKAIEYNSEYTNIAVGTYSVGDKVNVPQYTDYSFEAINNVTITSLYQRGVTAKSNELLPSYRCLRANRWFSEEQLTWFCNQLVDAATKGYKVIIAQHFGFTGNSRYMSSYRFNNHLFYTDDNEQNHPYNYVPNNSRFTAENSDIISDIVNAFYNKQPISARMEPVSGYDTRISYGDGDYIYDDCRGIESYDFSFDFSDEDYDIPSLCTYISGHYHNDVVMKHKEYDDQVGIVFLSGVVQNDKPYKDIFRSKTDAKTFDALTSYTIIGDKVHLCRIGNDTSIAIADGGLVRKNNEFINLK